MSKKRILYKFPAIGMRSIKTVFATLLAIIVSNIMKFESPFYAALSSFMCIQSTVAETSQMAIRRGLGTLIGGIFSLIYLVFMPQNIYLIPLGVLGIIYLYNVPHSYDVNIEYHNKQLHLFEAAYNHFSVLANMNEDVDKAVLQYHAEKINSIKNELQ